MSLFESTGDDFSEDSVELDNSWGVDVKAGKRINNWFSLEAEYQYVNGFDFNIDGEKALTLKANTLTGNVKFHYPIQRFIPYAVAGIGGTWFQVEDETSIGLDFDGDTVFAGRLGAGFDVFINKNWAVNANYTVVLTSFDLKSPSTTANLKNVHFGAFQVGLAYYF